MIAGEVQLVFTNMSDAVGQREGGKVRALAVLSRTSSMQLKGTSKDVRALGRELGVRYALTGSVRRAGDRFFWTWPTTRHIRR